MASNYGIIIVAVAWVLMLRMSPLKTCTTAKSPPGFVDTDMFDAARDNTASFKNS